MHPFYKDNLHLLTIKVMTMRVCFGCLLLEWILVIVGFCFGWTLTKLISLFLEWILQISFLTYTSFRYIDSSGVILLLNLEVVVILLLDLKVVFCPYKWVSAYTLILLLELFHLTSCSNTFKVPTFVQFCLPIKFRASHPRPPLPFLELKLKHIHGTVFFLIDIENKIIFFLMRNIRVSWSICSLCKCRISFNLLVLDLFQLMILSYQLWGYAL